MDHRMGSTMKPIWQIYLWFQKGEPPFINFASPSPQNKQTIAIFQVGDPTAKNMSPTHDVFTGLTLRKEAWLCWAPHSYAQWNTTPSFCHRTETGMNFGSEVELSFTKLGWVRKPAGLKYHQHVGYSYILSCLACHVMYTKTCILWVDVDGKCW